MGQYQEALTSAMNILSKNENAIETVIKLYDFLLENPDQFLANDKFRAILQTKIKNIYKKI